ncbi:MAG: hypothetical protein AB1664_01495 [Thermodesulfobacteriota bacterium]
MKTFIIAVILTAIMASAPFAFARGSNLWFAIHQQWKQEQARQKSLDRHFKKIERDAARKLKSLEGEKLPYSPSPAVETNPDTSVWRDCSECGG